MAKKSVVEYLENLEQKLPTQYGEILLPRKVTKASVADLKKEYHPTRKTSVDGIQLYIKTNGKIARDDPRRLRQKMSAEIIFSRLFNELGVASVKYYPVVTPKKMFSKDIERFLVSQSLEDIKGLETLQASKDKTLQKVIWKLMKEHEYTIEDIIRRRKELATYDERFADDNYFGEFVCMHMADNAFLLVDRSTNNFYSYSDKKTGKRGVITFDHERTAYDQFLYTHYENFANMVDSKRGMPYTPSIVCPVSKASKDYNDSLLRMRRILDSGVLGEPGRRFQRALARLDFGTLVDNAEIETGFSMYPDFIHQLRYIVGKVKRELCPEATMSRK